MYGQYQSGYSSRLVVASDFQIKLEKKKEAIFQHRPIIVVANELRKYKSEL